MSLAYEVSPSRRAPHARSSAVAAARAWIATLPDGEYAFATLRRDCEAARYGDLSDVALGTSYATLASSGVGSAVAK